MNKDDHSVNNASISQFKQIIYVFQGGGALGAYQVGVFQALAEHGYEPTWIIGTSIGAINAAIIAGNQPENRIPKLKEFWNSVASEIFPGFTPHQEATRRAYNWLSAENSFLFGQNNFFSLRADAFANLIQGTPDSVSFYVLDPLRNQLNDLINFKILNSKKIRFTLGVVEVSEGMTSYFDSKTEHIGPQHILASSALPPGFPAVEIDGKFYWDGGIISNSPTEILFRESTQVDSLCFMANLFDSYGLNPSSFDDVMKRRNDIIYSSQYRSEIKSYRDILRLRAAIRLLYSKLPDHLKTDPEIKEIRKQYGEQFAKMHFVRFLYSAPVTELSSKSYEFSKLSIAERIDRGYRDGLNALTSSPWFNSDNEVLGVAIHEISGHKTVLEKMDEEKNKEIEKEEEEVK